MRRADRLFLIIHALRGRRTALPARGLAHTLGVSLRTVYRDVADLQRSGVPIEGEAGVGYVLRKGSEIPPLMFNADELEALVVGARFVHAFAGARLDRGATAAMRRPEAMGQARFGGQNGAFDLWPLSITAHFHENRRPYCAVPVMLTHGCGALHAGSASRTAVRFPSPRRASFARGRPFPPFARGIE